MNDIRYLITGHSINEYLSRLGESAEKEDRNRLSDIGIDEETNLPYLEGCDPEEWFLDSWEYTPVIQNSK